MAKAAILQDGKNATNIMLTIAVRHRTLKWYKDPMIMYACGALTVCWQTSNGSRNLVFVENAKNA